MLLKQRKSFLFIILVSTILFLLSLTIDKQIVDIQKEDVVRKLMTLDLGISSFRNLVDVGDGQEIKSSDKIVPLISSIPKIIQYKLNSNNFERIDIDIKFSSYLNLMQDRKQAIRDGLLSNPTKVDAIIKYKGETYKAKLRLKGDLKDHWTSKYRMSFRVNLKNKKTVLNFNTFSIQKPISRQHPYDYVFQSLVRDTGNLAPIHKFAHIFVNGDDWGIMNIEEHVSKEFLEKQNKKDSIIVRFSNDEKRFYKESSKGQYNAYKISDPFIFLHLYNKKKYLKDIYNRKIYSYIAKNRLFNSGNIYDIDAFSKSLIMSLVWNDAHTLADSNSRYYFNPYTLKLEPITTDQGGWIEIQEGFPNINKQYLEILSNQSFIDRLPKNLKKVTQAVPNIKNYLSDFQILFPLDKVKSTRIIEENMRKILNNKEEYLLSPVALYSERIKSNDKSVVESPFLPTKEQASEFQKHLHIRHYEDGTLELYNLIPDNVIVKNILFNGKPFTEKEIIIPGYLSEPRPTVINTTYLGLQDNMFTVNTEYQGFDGIVKNDITLISDGIGNPLLLDTVNNFNFINKLDDKTYEMKKGDWTVNRPIIVNGDLRIPAGTNLQFSKNSYMIIKGSLTAIGDEENLINLRAMSDSWKGIYVLNADKKSHLKNLNISNLLPLEDELLKLTGGITFYKSDVDFYNVRINDIEAEDALNIVESKFSLNSVYINSAVSDGLDSDFSKGSISNSEFSDIGGDALDFSGSNVSIVKTEANNIKDKAVSAGEKSTLTIKDSTFNNIGVGIASKDGSSVTATDTKILNYKLYGAMTYLKKDFYDMPSLVINNVSVSDGHAYIRQKGTSMTVDGIDVPDTKISVKKLYKTKVMTK